ncbi:hypothetical protein [Kitasatospora sp. NPDC002965]|uniref:hypothetical protein n=1 Tax=Kitasatospora sp. NPDC002965 TaxID=3154775 RepID=UPI0033ABFC46
MTHQTFPGFLAEPVAFRAALRLYPARYRRERGDELSAVFADSTAEAGKLATAREAVDLGAYGLRMRAGLTASSRLGQLLAAAAPLIAGAIAGLGVAQALGSAVGSYRPRLLMTPDHITHVPGFIASVGEMFVPLLLVAFVLAGRRQAARVTALVVVLAGVFRMVEVIGVSHDGWQFFLGSCEATPQLVSGLLFALAPQELLERPTWRSRVVVVASMVGGGLVLLAEEFYSSFVLMDGRTAALLLIVPLVSLLGVARGRLAPAAMGLTVLALSAGFSLFRAWQVVGGAWRLLPLMGVALVVLLALGRILGRSGAGAGGGRSLA